LVKSPINGIYCIYTTFDAMKQKILLYNPEAVFFDMPLALLSIGSVLDPERFEVHILDARVDNKAAQKVLEWAGEAVCLGVTVLTGRPLRDALRLTRAVKKQFPNLPIVWGGWHPSLFGLEILQDEPAVDITVQGQGEDTFRELVEHLAIGAPISQVQGICYRDEAGVAIKNQARALTDMNLIPAVNYDLIDAEKYFIAKKRRQFDYISSTGCRFRCTFCADPFVFNRKWTAIEPDRIGEEFAHWQRKFGFTDVNFQDETFFTKRSRVVEVAEEFLRRDLRITWAGTMRADQGFRLSDEEFALVKRSGLRRVLVGVESGSQEMMDWLKKDIKIEQVWHVAEQCKRLGIEVIFPFIVGFPDESDKSFNASLDMARKLSAMSSGFTTPIFYFKPYPGSQITEEVVAKGYELPKNLEEWTDFDYVGGSSGPWVSPERFRKVERFKFYNKVAHGKLPWYATPARWIARQRMENDFFDYPVEQIVANKLMPRKQLS
jgi:anaerobic magnesium-protoporphyrin IX monomethyl ester cyclase